MRYLSILLLAVVCISSCKKNEAEQIADINKKRAEINEKLPKYTNKTADDLTTASNGSISGYYNDDEVKKINAAKYTDTCRTFTEFYFDDGMLIYIMKQNFIYNKPMSYTEEKATANKDSVWYDDRKTRLETNRFYFKKNNLIRWINNSNKAVDPKSLDFINKQSELWAEAAICIKQLKEQ